MSSPTEGDVPSDPVLGGEKLLVWPHQPLSDFGDGRHDHIPEHASASLATADKGM